MPARPAVVGVTEHGNSAVLVTVAGAELVDRRRVDLTHDLPTHPYHHEGSWAVGRYRDSAWARDVTLPEAVALVATVEKAAARGAQDSLARLADDVAVTIAAITLRQCPELPPTIEARIADNRAQAVADTVMYRRALAAAAEALGWSVIWYDRDVVFDQAARALGVADVNAALAAMGKTVGAPWQAKHKLAAAAAVACGYSQP